MLKDCARVLKEDAMNVKALYRSARACFALDKMEEADDAIRRALEIDAENTSFLKLKDDIAKRKGIVTAQREEDERKAQRKRDEERALKAALKVLLHYLSLIRFTIFVFWQPLVRQI